MKESLAKIKAKVNVDKVESNNMTPIDLVSTSNKASVDNSTLHIVKAIITKIPYLFVKCKWCYYSTKTNLSRAGNDNF